MPDKTETGPRQNPLPWISLAVVGLILFVIIGGDRDDNQPNAARQAEQPLSGEIQRELLLPPGMRAREYISQLRETNKPYRHDEIHDRALRYLSEGSLADAHLLFFFAAREGHLPAIMKLAEMSDPNFFRVEDSLLDQADVIQAYKWYGRAADLGHSDAVERIHGLRQWAVAEADAGNRQALQLLLNFQQAR